MAQTTSGSAALEQFLARTSLGDQAAFRSLYEATSRCLLAIIARLLRDPAWAEEVLQEAYVSIWHCAPNYAVTRSQPMTWLMAIARNKALDALRSTHAERAHTARPLPRFDGDDPIEDALTPEIEDDRADPLDRLVQQADAGKLGHCLQTLEAAQRQAIALAFFNGLTHAELADHLGQPLGTVKAWVRRGLERLKRCVEG